MGTSIAAPKNVQRQHHNQGLNRRDRECRPVHLVKNPGQSDGVLSWLNHRDRHVSGGPRSSNITIRTSLVASLDHLLGKMLENVFHMRLTGLMERSIEDEAS